jgi:hypothetical protein
VLKEQIFFALKSGEMNVALFAESSRLVIKIDCLY